MHYSTLAEVFKSQHVGIAADETTDARDHNILNVMTSVHGKPHLIGAVHMEACNHFIFSQAIIQSVTDIGIDSVKLLLWYLIVLPIAITADSAA